MDFNLRIPDDNEAPIGLNLNLNPGAQASDPAPSLDLHLKAAIDNDNPVELDLVLTGSSLSGTNQVPISTPDYLITSTPLVSTKKTCGVAEVVPAIPGSFVDTNNYVTGVSFVGGVLRLNRLGLPDLTTSLDGRYLTSYTETDPVFGASVAASITATNISNWNSAFGWGDHSLAGYLKSYIETDPTVPAWVKTILEAQITQWNTAYLWGNHADAGYLKTETDPTVPTWVKAITATQITNWNSAYSWGNHALAGYLTAETDPVFSASAAATITSTLIGHWNTAYTWGNHAGLYVPIGRQITINGNTQDLTVDRTWTIPTAWSDVSGKPNGGEFIYNQNAAAQVTSNFWISGTGTMAALKLQGGGISWPGADNTYFDSIFYSADDMLTFRVRNSLNFTTASSNKMVIGTSGISVYSTMWFIVPPATYASGGYDILVRNQGSSGQVQLLPLSALTPDWSTLTGKPNSGNFIYNQNSAEQASASFWIDGSGKYSNGLNYVQVYTHSSGNPQVSGFTTTGATGLQITGQYPGHTIYGAVDIFGSTPSGTALASTYKVLHVRSAGGDNHLNIFGDGNVSINIGTNYGYKLDVYGSSRFSGGPVLINSQYLKIERAGSLVWLYDTQGWVADAKGWFLATTSFGNGAAFTIATATDGGSTISNILNIHRTGNVGIGTTTDAGYKLDVNGSSRISSTATEVLRLTSSYGSSPDTMTFSKDYWGGYNVSAGYQLSLITNTATRFYNGATQLASIGNGTYTLDVNGTGRFTDNVHIGSTGSASMLTVGYSPTNYRWQLIMDPQTGNYRMYAGDSTQQAIMLYMAPSGVMGIGKDLYLTGTTNPIYGTYQFGSGNVTMPGSLIVGGTADAGYKLDVNGNVRINDGGAGTGITTFSTSTSGSIGYILYVAGGMYMRATAGNTLTFGANDAYNMSIGTSGNVTIGGTLADAGYKLDVNGTGRFSSSLGAATVSAGGYFTNARMTVSGTYGAASLGLYLQPDSDTVKMFLINDAANTTNRHYMQGDGTVVLANGGGNVGIGTVPSYKLDVSGNFRVSPRSLMTDGYVFIGDQTAFQIQIGAFRDTYTNGARDLMFSAGQFDFKNWNGTAYTQLVNIGGAYTLDVSGTAHVNGVFTNTLNGTNFVHTYGGAGTYSSVPMIGTLNVGEYWVLKSCGNSMMMLYNDSVTINTTTYSGYTLDVNGTARTTGATYLGTSGGLVGVGTTSPASYLAGVYGISVYDSNFSGISLATSTRFHVLYTRESTGVFELYQGGYGTVMQVYNGGDVGIGTTSHSGYKLDVNGTVRISTLATGSTAPTTTGTAKMLISDTNGLLSFAPITWDNANAILSVPGQVDTTKTSTATANGAHSYFGWSTVNFNGATGSTGAIFGSSVQFFTMNVNASQTLNGSANYSTLLNLLRIGASTTTAGTYAATISGGGNTRAVSANGTFVQLDTLSTGVAVSLDSVAAFQVFAPQASNGSGVSSANLASITNYYGILIGSTTEYSNASAKITNRYGIYQVGSSDVNYFAGFVKVNNDIEITDDTKGLILSAGGVRYRVTMTAGGGSLTITAI